MDSSVNKLSINSIESTINEVLTLSPSDSEFEMTLSNEITSSSTNQIIALQRNRPIKGVTIRCDGLAVISGVIENEKELCKELGYNERRCYDDNGVYKMSETSDFVDYSCPCNS